MKNIIVASLCLWVILGCAQRGGDPNTIVVWHWMTDRQDAFDKLAQKYEKETGIKVKFDLYAPSDVYSQKIVAAGQARVLPDIFGILDKKAIIASFIESGLVADLTEEFQKDDAAWEKSLFSKALSVNRFTKGNVYGIPPGIYGVPLDVMNIQMLYNKKLLAKAGIDQPPRTFKEWIGSVETLRRMGIPGLVSGWGERWMVNCFALNYAFNIMGEEKVMSTYQGEIPYTDPDWIKVFDVFAILAEKDVLAEGIVTKINKDAEQDFALERAAFAFNGSWCVNVYHDMNPGLEYGAMIPPPVNPKLPMSIYGGAGSSFMVSSVSPKKDKAIDFLKWLTEKDQQVFLAQKTMNLPSNKQAVSAMPEVLSEFTSNMDLTTHPAIWKYNEDPVVSEVFDRGIQSIIIGEKTPQEVAEEVQKIKARQLKRKGIL